MCVYVWWPTLTTGENGFSFYYPKCLFFMFCFALHFLFFSVHFHSGGFFFILFYHLYYALVSHNTYTYVLDIFHFYSAMCALVLFSLIFVLLLPSMLMCVTQTEMMAFTILLRFIPFSFSFLPIPSLRLFRSLSHLLTLFLFLITAQLCCKHRRKKKLAKMRYNHKNLYHNIVLV